MKKIIIFIIMTMVLIPNINVNAECINLLENLTHWTLGTSSGGYKGGRTTLRSNFTIDESVTDIITLEQGKTYTFYINDASESFYDVLFNHDGVVSDYTFELTIYKNSNAVIIHPGESQVSGLNTFYSLYDNFITFTATDTSFQLSIIGYKNDINTYKTYFESATFWLVEGDSVCIESAEPEVPPVEEPDIPEITPDTTLTDFYSLYLDKLTQLSQYTLENKFLLSAIGVILAFVVLELVLFLFNRGGYKR